VSHVCGFAFILLPTDIAQWSETLGLMIFPAHRNQTIGFDRTDGWVVTIFVGCSMPKLSGTIRNLGRLLTVPDCCLDLNLLTDVE